MTWEDIANQTGISQSDINQYQAYGWDPNQFGQALSTGLSPADISEFHAAGMNPTEVMERFQPSPETRARQQMAAIDPRTEALRQQFGESVLDRGEGDPGITESQSPVGTDPGAGAVPGRPGPGAATLVCGTENECVVRRCVPKKRAQSN